MQSSDDQATRHAADPNQVLLDRYVDGNLYIRNQKAADSINAELSKPVFQGGKNYPIRDHLGSLHTVLSHDGTPGQAALREELSKSLKLGRDDIKTVLTGAYAPAHDRDTDAATLLGSAMLKHRPELAGPDQTSYQKLQTLSANNLRGIDEQLAHYKAMPDMQAYAQHIQPFMADVFSRYANGIVTHATNSTVSGHISPTADRIAIDKFASDFSGDRSASQKLSHTSETNTQHLQTHDLVFFNVYPKTNDEMTAEQMRSTRYLREKPEVPGSPYAEGARSYSFPMRSLVSENEHLQVMTLRDPVYPSGGTTQADAKRRLEQGGFATVGGGDQPPGVAVRTIGDTVDRYETEKNVFVGRDIVPALSKNVELGLYKTFHGLHEAHKNNPADTREQDFFMKIKGANEATGPAKDKQVMDVVKMYQYPQLMISGSVPIKDAKVYDPSKDPVVQAQSRAQPAAATPGAATQAPLVHDRDGKAKVEAALGGKQVIAKTPQNARLVADYVDHLTQEHGVVTGAKLVNSKMLRINFDDKHQLDIKPEAMSTIKSTMERVAQTRALQPEGASASSPTQPTASSSSNPLALTPGSQGGDEQKVQQRKF